MNLTETQRGWLYVGALLIGIAAVVFGVVTAESAETVITGIILVLTGGLATRNTLLKPKGDDGAVTLWTVVAVLAIAVFVVLLIALVDVDIRGK